MTFFIRKIVLLSDSVLNKEKFIAVGIINKTGKLAYYKNSDQSWTSMGDAGFSCCDVTYYEGKFYAVDVGGDGAFDWDRGIYTLRRNRRIISLPFRMRDPHALWFTPTP
jgi:hypothetical protein